MHGWLAVLFIVSALATGAELVLVEHYEDWWQRAPLLVLGLGIATSLAAWARPAAGTFWAQRIFMVVLLVVGVVGFYLHLQWKIEWELELDPSLKGLNLIWAAMKGSTPPALAPLTIGQLGILGFLLTFRHPRLARHKTEPRPTLEEKQS